ncbi:hypothetical protein NKJ06_18870 [Mesorhizobium sp. M0293]|uniref:hypothetical protein n=1 Tax=Mesorhizobium sp. M0293 TaxID=2956930 RepID=UPI003336D22F
MTSVPIMPLNVDKLLSDKKVQRLMRGGETRAFWVWFLTQMWANKAWLPADERIVSDMLDVDVRRWRNKYKPIFEQLLLQEVDPVVGHIYRHQHLSDVWDRVAKRISETHASLARARAGKAAKHGKTPSVTEPKKPPAAEPVQAPAAEPSAGFNKNLEKKGGPPPIPRLGGSPFSAPTVDVPALPPRGLNGHAERSAVAGSPSLKGGSPAKPSDALLRSRLVAKRLDEDDEPQASRPSGDTGLFGALEAAIRHGKSEED